MSEIKINSLEIKNQFNDDNVNDSSNYFKNDNIYVRYKKYYDKTSTKTLKFSDFYYSIINIPIKFDYNIKTDKIIVLIMGIRSMNDLEYQWIINIISTDPTNSNSITYTGTSIKYVICKNKDKDNMSFGENIFSPFLGEYFIKHKNGIINEEFILNYDLMLQELEKTNNFNLLCNFLDVFKTIINSNKEGLLTKIKNYEILDMDFFEEINKNDNKILKSKYMSTKSKKIIEKIDLFLNNTNTNDKIFLNSKKIVKKDYNNISLSQNNNTYLCEIVSRFNINIYNDNKNSVNYFYENDNIKIKIIEGYVNNSKFIVENEFNEKININNLPNDVYYVIITNKLQMEIIGYRPLLENKYQWIIHIYSNDQKKSNTFTGTTLKYIFKNNIFSIFSALFLFEHKSGIVTNELKNDFNTLVFEYEKNNITKSSCEFIKKIKNILYDCDNGLLTNVKKNKYTICSSKSLIVNIIRIKDEIKDDNYLNDDNHEKILNISSLEKEDILSTKGSITTSTNEVVNNLLSLSNIIDNKRKIIFEEERNVKSKK